MANIQSSSEAQPRQYAAFVGLDWAEQKHAVYLLEPDVTNGAASEVEQQPDAIAQWAAELLQRYQGRPVAVAIELSRGAIINALQPYAHLVLIPINPQQLANYRKALYVSKKKNDPTDAQLLARFVREHHTQLRVWQPDSAVTRELGAYCELRRTLVDDRKTHVQKLRSLLLTYFPLVFELGRELQHPKTLELLQRWPTLKDLQRARPDALRQFWRGARRKSKELDVVQQIRAAKPLTTDPAVLEPAALYLQILVRQITQLNEAVEQVADKIRVLFAQHPEADLYRSLPGAGEALAPRLLVALGDNRERYASADNLQARSGIAPITISSGKSQQVQSRIACPKFLRQTFHEFADHARKWSVWSKAYYQAQRVKGKKHQAAVRALAFKWIRILFRMWQDRVAYDEARHLTDLQKRHSPLAASIKTS